MGCAKETGRLKDLNTAKNNLIMNQDRINAKLEFIPINIHPKLTTQYPSKSKSYSKTK